MLIDGLATANKLRAEIAQNVAKYKTQTGKVPGIAVILIGDDPASMSYVGSKEKAAQAAGMHSVLDRLPSTTTEAELLAKIAELNRDASIHGILVQLPLPSHIDEMKVIMAIDPKKDVDGFHPVNVGLLSIGSKDAFISCTPYGVMKLLEEYNIDLAGKHAVIVGRSNIVGKPMATLLLQANATVTICHSKTKDLKATCREADILVAAIGRARMINADYVKPGAVVIDVGINRVDGKLCGDVDFDAVSGIASAITPVPKGVGPMTITMLMQNTLESFMRVEGLS
jgi:methylenetetrahydrofolate dehydrogenase (NADP+)/methenyltetrahydrofolate cyclohydrolase